MKSSTLHVPVKECIQTFEMLSRPEAPQTVEWNGDNCRKGMEWNGTETWTSMEWRHTCRISST